MWSRLRRVAGKKSRQSPVRLQVEYLEDRVVPAPFTAGNLVVYRVGSGSGGLVNTGNDVFLDEYSPTGILVQSVPLPAVDPDGTDPQHAFVASGTATSEGLLNLSADGRYLLLTGYDPTNAPATGSLTGVAASSVPRVVGRVDAAGNIDTSTALTDFADPNNPRSAVSTNGTDIWVTGGTGGIRYATLGSTTSTQISTTVTNLRNVQIFNGQLYVSTNSGSAVRIGTVGTGTPTTAGQTITNLPGFPTSGSPYGFFLADLSTAVPGLDTLYVADDDDTTGGIGGFTKYSLVGGVWVANGTIGGGADDYRGLTAMVSGTTVTLFATRKGSGTAIGGGELVKLVDSSGYNGAFSGTPALLATATTNTAFRGVAFVPTAPDTTAPTVTFDDGDPDDAVGVGTVLTYTIQFSEAVTGVEQADFALTGTATANITGFSSIDGDTYTVQVTTTGAGTLNLGIVAGAAIKDAANNELVVPVADDTTVTVTANAVPTVTLPGGAISYAENDPATILDPNATVTDTDSPNFDTGTLTVDFTNNGTDDDRLEIRHQGTDPGQIGVSGSNVTFGGTTIGTFTGGTSLAAPLVVTFNTNATPTAVQALLRNIAFRNGSDAPSGLARTVRVVLTDGDGGTSSAVTKTVNFAIVNDPPVVTLPGGAVTFVENGPPVLLDAGATLTDVDSGIFDSSQLTVDFTSGGTADDLLAIRTEGTGAGQINVVGTDVRIGTTIFGNIIGSGVGTTPLVIRFNGSTTTPILEALLRNITFSNASDTPSAAPRTVRFVITEGLGGTNSAPVTKTVNVTAVNDAPSGTDATVTTLEDTAYTFTTADFGFTDLDANTLLSVKITALPSVGTLALNGSPVTADQFVSAADITTGLLRFAPRGRTPAAPATRRSPSRCGTTAAPTTAARTSTRRPIPSPSMSPPSTTRRPWRPSP